MSVCCFLERPLLEVVYRAEALRAKAGSIFDNRQLEVERELQLIYEIGGRRGLLAAPDRQARAKVSQGRRRPRVLSRARPLPLSVYGRTTDALASGGYEGRGRLRQAAGSRQRALIRRFPNGATRPPSSAVIHG